MIRCDNKDITFFMIIKHVRQLRTASTPITWQRDGASSALGYIL